MNVNLRRLLLVVFLLFLSQSLAAVLIPLEATAIGLGASAVGLLVALPQVIGLVIDIPFAAWSDIVGRRLPVIVGSAAGALAGLMFAAGDSLLVLGIAAFVLGISMSLSTGPSLAFVTEAAPPNDHARIQGFNGAIQGLSTLTGATGAGILVTAIGPRHSFWTLVAVLAAASWIAVALREEARPHIGSPLRLNTLAGRYRRVLELVRNEPAIRMAGSVSLLYQYQLMTLQNSFVPLYLVSDRHYSGAVVGLLLAARSLVGVMLSALFGGLFRRYGLVRLIVLSNVLGLGGVLLVVTVADPLALMIAFALQGAGIAFGPATSNLLITSATSEDERGIGFSTVGLTARLGGIAFPVLLGVSAEAGGFNLMFVVAAVVGAATLGVMWVCTRSLGLLEDR